MIQALIILGLIWLSILIMFIWVCWWMKRNSILIQISDYKNGVLMSSGGRYRLSKNNRLYGMLDLWKQKALSIDYDLFKDYFIITESIPLIGIKLTLKLINTEIGLKPWKPTGSYNKSNLIKNTLVAWSEQTRKELYESTKTKMSKEEMITNIVIPLSIIILALACVVFFPKMYHAVMESGNAVASTAFERFSGVLKEYIPLG